MNPDVDAYIAKSDLWPEEIAALRPILLASGLTEAIKWRSPCYSHGGKNVVIIQEMKPHLALMFFKGALLADPDGVLEEQGPNSRSARRITFTSVEDVERLAATVTAYLEAAIAVEDEGRVVESDDLVLVSELQERIDRDPAFKAAFEALTPGRQREYNLNVSSAKQASTREARVEKFAPRILEGKGMRDR